MDVEQLAREYLAEDDDLIRRDIIAEIYRTLKPMIFKISNRFTNYAELDDLMQEAFFGIYSALLNYNPEQSSFTTYVYKHITWHLIRYVSKNETSAMDDYIKIKKFEERFFIKMGYMPSDVQIALNLRITVNRLNQIRNEIRASQTISIDDNLPGTDIPIKDCIADDSADAEEEACRENLQHIVREAVKRLPGDEEELISRRFFNDETLKDLCSDEKLSRKIYQSGLKHLRSDKQIKALAIEEGILCRVYRWHHGEESHTEWAGIQLYELSCRK